MKNEVRLIKKYPNRRLYDTETSTYITLVDVKQYVLDNEPFKVVDAKSNEDLTRSILLQIILEEESVAYPCFLPRCWRTLFVFMVMPCRA
jgi:polyhydroxyalkanoate synthesis repressor PhaR